MKKVDMIGKKYGHFIVLEEHSTTRSGHTKYVCKCECGGIVNVLGTHLRQGNSKSCGCKNPLGVSHKQWTGCGEMSGDFWYSHIVRSANGSKGSRSSVDLTVSKEYVWDLFLKQNRKCALSGLELTFPKKSKDKSYTASLDRIDSGKGYVPDNVQWVHKDVNFMKNKFNNEYFINMCKNISNFNK